jgi:hypothetical protein
MMHRDAEVFEFKGVPESGSNDVGGKAKEHACLLLYDRSSFSKVELSKGL